MLDINHKTKMMLLLDHKYKYVSKTTLHKVSLRAFTHSSCFLIFISWVYYVHT
jgi:hypothetical protein